MKVRELTHELSLHDPDAEIYCSGYFGGMPKKLLKVLFSPFNFCAATFLYDDKPLCYDKPWIEVKNEK